MLSYKRYPLNAWMYGIPMLILLFFPLARFAFFFTPEGEVFNETVDLYMEVMLFPYELSLRYLLPIPYVGIVLIFLSYALHAHIYCVILERLSVLFRKAKV